MNLSAKDRATKLMEMMFGRDWRDDYDEHHDNWLIAVSQFEAAIESQQAEISNSDTFAPTPFNRGRRMQDTATIINITLRDLQWLVFAVRNVQTRTPGEAAMRGDMAVEFDRIIEANPNQREPFAIPFTPGQLMLCAWAANEGRCRDGDEMLIKGRLRQMFNEACGIQGVNGLV